MRTALLCGLVVLTLGSLAPAEEIRPLRVLRGDHGTLFALTFSPDGKRLVSGNHRGKLELWNLETGLREAACENQFRATGPYESPAIHAAHYLSKHRLVTAGSEPLLRFWSLEDDALAFTEELSLRPAPQPQVRLTGAGTIPTFGPAGENLPVAAVLQLSSCPPGQDELLLHDQDGRVIRWKPATNEKETLELPFRSPLTISGNGQWIVGQQGNRLFLYDVKLHGVERELNPAVYGPCLLAIADSKTVLAAVSVPGLGHTVARREVTVKLIATDELHCRLPHEHPEVHQLKLSPNGRYLVAVGAPGEGYYHNPTLKTRSAVTVWDLKEQRRLPLSLDESAAHSFLSHPRPHGSLYCAAFSPDSQLLAVGGMSGNVTVFRLGQ